MAKRKPTRSRRIDLHGLTLVEAMEKFINFYNKCIRDNYKDRIEVIHGYGSEGKGGDIKRELSLYLNSNIDKLRSLNQGDALGNPGITVLYPNQKLPAFKNLQSTHKVMPKIKW
jgi:DNA-nicking Smr family endonuclease